MKKRNNRSTRRPLSPALRTVKLTLAVAIIQAVAATSVNANEVLTDSGAYKPDTNQLSEPTGSDTLPKVTVEADAEADLYDPTNTNDPYNQSYSVSDSSTSTKTDTPIMETPATIQVVPKSVLHDQQAYRLEDALKNVPGVQSYHSYGGEHEQFVMRGFLQSTVNFRNGIRIPFSKFDLANVERVEVLKGASAMLFGFADPGGIVSTVTKQPSDTPYYSLEQRFGSYDFFRTEASATGPLSKEHGLNYRIDLSYLDKNSFRQYISNDRIFFAPTFSWQPTDDTKLTLSYEHFDENNAYDWGLPAFGGRLNQIPISRNLAATPDLHNSTTRDLIDFRIDHRFNDNIKLNTGTVATHYNKNWEAIYTGRPNEDPTDNIPDGEVSRSYWFSPEKATALTAWINGTFDFETYGIKHKVLLGADYYLSELSYDGAFGGLNSPVNIFDPNIPAIPISKVNELRNLPRDTFHVATETTTKGIYLQDQMTFWEKLHIMGGFRYDWVERYQDLSWNGPDLREDSRSDDFVSPRVGILYEATDWLSVFGSFSESFGPASDYDTGGNKLYDLNTASQFEGGLKTSFFDGKLTANLAYFDLERTQFFQDPNTDRPISASVPVKGNSNGVEFDVQGQIYDGLSMIGTYAFTNTEIIKDPTSPGNVGNWLPYAPKHQGSVWLKYDFNDGLLKGLSLGGGVYAAGRRYGDQANSYFDDAYARVDLMAAYKKKLGDMTLTTQLNVNNVNDARYFAGLRRAATNLPAEPLTVMGSIKLEY